MIIGLARQYSRKLVNLHLCGLQDEENIITEHYEKLQCIASKIALKNLWKIIEENYTNISAVYTDAYRTV